MQYQTYYFCYVAIEWQVKSQATLFVFVFGCHDSSDLHVLRFYGPNQRQLSSDATVNVSVDVPCGTAKT